MWDGQRVSVVLMTYAERDSIRAVIEGFLNEWIRLRRANDVQGLVRRRRLLAEDVAKALREV